ncbi:MAG: hypothetical protein IKC24_07035 [Oscillospiraceae bacterium]|nr:hypothetical protein [Oscillospiraceae bacterium]MBR6677297.1 hypothetical protein [Oscillospiraceae bacterium]
MKKELFSPLPHKNLQKKTKILKNALDEWKKPAIITFAVDSATIKYGAVSKWS